MQAVDKCPWDSCKPRGRAEISQASLRPPSVQASSRVWLGRRRYAGSREMLGLFSPFPEAVVERLLAFRFSGEVPHERGGGGGG